MATPRRSRPSGPPAAPDPAEPKPRFRLFDDPAIAELRALWERKQAQRQRRRDHPPKPHELDNQPDEPG